MKRALATLILLLFLPLSTTPSTTWPVVKIKKSLVQLVVDKPAADGGGKGTCTGFSIDEIKGLYVTAAHCATGAVRAGDVEFEVIEVVDSPDVDLALLSADVVLPALPTTPPKEAGDYLGVGFPAGSNKPFFFPMMYQGDIDKGAVFVGSALGGMSGGPIVDKTGAVVSVITAGGRPGTQIQDITFGTVYKAMMRLILRHR